MSLLPSVKHALHTGNAIKSWIKSLHEMNPRTPFFWYNFIWMIVYQIQFHILHSKIRACRNPSQETGRVPGLLKRTCTCTERRRWGRQPSAARTTFAGQRPTNVQRKVTAPPLQTQRGFSSLTPRNLNRPHSPSYRTYRQRNECVPATPTFQWTSSLNTHADLL